MVTDIIIPALVCILIGLLAVLSWSALREYFKDRKQWQRQQRQGGYGASNSSPTWSSFLTRDIQRYDNWEAFRKAQQTAVGSTEGMTLGKGALFFKEAGQVFKEAGQAIDFQFSRCPGVHDDRITWVGTDSDPLGDTQQAVDEVCQSGGKHEPTTEECHHAVVYTDGSFEATMDDFVIPGPVVLQIDGKAFRIKEGLQISDSQPEPEPKAEQKTKFVMIPPWRIRGDDYKVGFLHHCHAPHGAKKGDIVSLWNIESGCFHYIRGVEATHDIKYHEVVAYKEVPA